MTYATNKISNFSSVHLKFQKRRLKSSDDASVKRLDFNLKKNFRQNAEFWEDVRFKSFIAANIKKVYRIRRWGTRKLTQIGSVMRSNVACSLAIEFYDQEFVQATDKIRRSFMNENSSCASWEAIARRLTREMLYSRDVEEISMKTALNHFWFRSLPRKLKWIKACVQVVNYFLVFLSYAPKGSWISKLKIIWIPFYILGSSPLQDNLLNNNHVEESVSERFKAVHPELPSFH